MAGRNDNASRREAARLSGDGEYRQRRADLVRAAGQVFRRKGFQAANLNDIAEEAGVDRASLYYYVSGKQEFFEEVVLVAVQKNLVIAQDVMALDLPARSKIAALMERLMASYEEHYPYLFVYVQENMAHLEGASSWHRQMQDLGRRYAEIVTHIIHQGVEAGDLRLPEPLNAQLVAYAMIGICNWSHRWFRPDGALAGRDIGAGFADLFIDGLRA